MAKLFFKIIEKGATPVLGPSDGRSLEALKKWEIGDIVVADVRRPRNPRHNAKFWVLMQTVWESTEVQDRYASPRALAKAIELALGYFDTVKLPDGTVGYAIHSLNFESMSQEDFISFYDQAIEVICSQLIPHVDEDDIRKEVERLTQ